MVSPVQLLDSASVAPRSTPARGIEYEQEEEGEIGMLDATLAPTDGKPLTDGTTASDGGLPMDTRSPSDGIICIQSMTSSDDILPSRGRQPSNDTTL